MSMQLRECRAQRHSALSFSIVMENMVTDSTKRHRGGTLAGSEKNVNSLKELRELNFHISKANLNS